MKFAPVALAAAGAFLFQVSTRLPSPALSLRSAIFASPTARESWHFHASPMGISVRAFASGRAEISDEAGVITPLEGPIHALNKLDALAALCPPGHLYLGYFAYELASCFEKLPSHADANLPLFDFSLCRISRLPAWKRQDAPASASGSGKAVLAPSHTKACQYVSGVSRVIEYIRNGDVFQANLARQMDVPIAKDAIAQDVFNRLNGSSALCAPYAACLEFDSFALVSQSPELFLKVEAKGTPGQRLITTRPIKGTRPNQPGAYEQLLHSEKDKAELAMIVDLMRNDLGRVSTLGSVRVTDPRSIETYPTLHHAAATIAAQLRPGVRLPELLAATFPCGSVTGAPKIRAMQIIHELEQRPRGAYCGAIGWLGPNGTMELSVAIRTMTLRNGIATVPVGAGIVADSDPQQELEETNTKAQAMLAAISNPR